MALLPLEVPAGILAVDSPNSGKGRFTDSDKCHFVAGYPEKWPGWQQFIDDLMLGVARGAVAWVNEFGNTNAAFGTHLKLYSLQGDDTLTDRTPIRASSTINTNPFAVTDGSAVV